MMHLVSILVLALECALAVAKGGVHVSINNHHKTCTVKSNGCMESDVSNILGAFKECGKDATIIFPDDETYWIDEKLHAILQNVNLEWRGKWMYSNDTSYWRQNSYYIAFQNHRAGFILSGDNIRIDGHGTGGINGNGDVWYDEDKGKSTEGRPLPIVLWNITNSAVNNFHVKQSQFWSFNIINGTNLYFKNLTCSSISTNAPSGTNWVQNADGFNTMDVQDVRLDGFTYRGGDDCIAIKPRSFNVEIRNVVCEGGNGIAIGSLGQYLEDSTVEDIIIKNVKVGDSYNDTVWLGHEMVVYIKTWVGYLVPSDNYENEGQPRGGGWGAVQRLLFENFELKNVSRGPYITQNNGNNGSYAGTSKMEISNLTFRNFYGTLKSSSAKLGEISCSKTFPCHDIIFEDMDNLSAGNGSCKWANASSIVGLPGCSTL